MNTLTMNDVIVTAKNVPADARSKVIVTILWIRAAAQNRKPFKLFLDGTISRAVSRKDGQVEIGTPRHTLRNLSSVCLGSADIGVEARGYHEDPNNPLWCGSL